MLVIPEWPEAESGIGLRISRAAIPIDSRHP